MKMRVKKLHPDAILPKYALNGDAGMDLFSLDDHIVKPDGAVYKIATGIAFEIPAGHAGLIWDKSGISLKAIKTVGGVIDSSYRGDITVGVINLGSDEYIVKSGDKIAQILIQRVEQPEIVESEELSDSDRGDKRYGSTGIK